MLSVRTVRLVRENSTVRKEEFTVRKLHFIKQRYCLSTTQVNFNSETMPSAKVIAISIFATFLRSDGAVLDQPRKNSKGKKRRPKPLNCFSKISKSTRENSNSTASTWRLICPACTRNLGVIFLSTARWLQVFAASLAEIALGITLHM